MVAFKRRIQMCPHKNFTADCFCKACLNTSPGARSWKGCSAPAVKTSWWARAPLSLVPDVRGLTRWAAFPGPWKKLGQAHVFLALSVVEKSQAPYEPNPASLPKHSTGVTNSSKLEKILVRLSYVLKSRLVKRNRGRIDRGVCISLKFRNIYEFGLRSYNTPLKN